MNKFMKLYTQLCKDPKRAKFEMVRTAAGELFKAVQENYYHAQDLEDLNFSEVCAWCGWPDFQDGGIFEQHIRIAANMVLEVLGEKPQH